MTNIDRLDDLLFKIGTGTGGDYAELIDVAADVVSEVRRETAPTIIRTVEELEAEDPDTIVQCPLSPHCEWPREMTVSEVLRQIKIWEFEAVPAAVIAEGSQARAARKALEEASE